MDNVDKSHSINPGASKIKHCYLGAPAMFLLERECFLLNKAFGYNRACCYLVGSVLEKPNFRDVDIRLIMKNENFKSLFPDAGSHCQHDARWLIMTASISEHLTTVIKPYSRGKWVDFQFQSQIMSNIYYDEKSYPIGITYVKDEES